jgi:hypothetical protein
LPLAENVQSEYGPVEYGIVFNVATQIRKLVPPNVNGKSAGSASLRRRWRMLAIEYGVRGAETSSRNWYFMKVAVRIRCFKLSALKSWPRA